MRSLLLAYRSIFPVSHDHQALARMRGTQGRNTLRSLRRSRNVSPYRVPRSPSLERGLCSIYRSVGDFSRRPGTRSERSEGERGERDPTLGMPRLAGGAGSGHDHAPIRIASWLRATNKIVHVQAQAQRDTRTEGGHGESYKRPCMLGMDGGCTESGSCGRTKEPERGCRSRSCRRK